MSGGVPVPKPKPVDTPSPIPVVTIGTPPTSVPPASTINQTATSPQDIQAQVVAENALLRIPYGRVSLGAQVADVMVYAGLLVVFVVWGEGGAAGIDAIETVYLDDVAVNNSAFPNGAFVANYLGDQTTPDPTLVQAYLANGFSYDDVLAGIAYSVLQIPTGVTSGFPKVAAVLRGLKVYDPRDGTQTLGVPSTYKYSENPSLCMADLETNAVYGAGGTVDWTSVTAAANENDAVVAGVEKRRMLGLVIDNSQDIEAWRETMRAYAGCFVDRAGGTVKLVPDRPANSSFTFNETTASTVNCRVRNVKRRSKRNVPTVVAIHYTDTSAYPWRDRMAYAYAPGVQGGAVPWKMSDVQLPGITRDTQALREAIERLNKLTLNDITLDIDGQDEALAVTMGDVVTVSANIGLTSRLVRVLQPQISSPGRPTFSCEAYDPAVYSDSVTSLPTVVDTALPNPSQLAPPTGPLVILEHAYLEQDNGSTLAAGLIYQERFECSWTAPASSFPVDYRVEVWDGATRIVSAFVSGTTYSTPPLQQRRTYTVKVYSRNTITESATALEGSQFATGKSTLPGPVPRITRATSLGGKVIFNWDAAADVDVVRYEWRYTPNVTGGGTWAGATFIDRVDGLGTVFQGLPTGTHRFYVRPIDSIGQYSTSDCTVDLQVDSDPNAFLSSKTFSSPTLTNMVAIPMLEGVWEPRWITDAGDLWSTGTSPVSSGPDPIATEHSNATQTWRSEAWDVGSLVSGAFSITAFNTALSGTINSYIESSPDNAVYTRQPGVSWQGTGRFFRVTFEALNGDTFEVDRRPKLSLAALTKTEPFEVLTSASVGVLVQLANNYATKQDLQVTASEATSARIGTYSRLLLHPQTGLFLQGDITGAGGNSVLGFQPAASAYTLVSGDKLQYDVYIDPGSPAVSSFSDGGMQLVFTDTTGINTATDADGYNAIDPAVGFDVLARGVWKSRSIDLTAFAGKTTGATNFVRSRLRSDSVGTHKVLIRNVRITNSAGTVTRMTLWSSGDPGVTVISSVSAANQKAGPANSFLVYCFTDAGAQVAQTVNVSFRGY